MGNCSKISLNAREQLEQFLGIFFTRFSKPRLKFLGCSGKCGTVSGGMRSVQLRKVA